jgi:hypothetical protein
VVSWNVAGVAERDLNTFYDHLGDAHPWDVLCLQEAFRRTEGLAPEMGTNSDVGHLVYTPTRLHGGLRCPAIVVHKNSSHLSKFVGSANRWVAIAFNRKTLIISAHLPHRRLPTPEFAETLEELSGLITKHPQCKVVLGMDANARVAGMNDGRIVGPSVPSAELSARERERVGLLHEFLARHNMYLANTWANEQTVERMVTRIAWDNLSAAQVDFIAASSPLRLVDTAVDGHTSFSSDHFAVHAEFGGDAGPPVRRERRPTMLNWKPADSWFEHAAAEDWQWSDWDSCCRQWGALTTVHREPALIQKSANPELEALLEEAKLAPPALRRYYSKRIWRLRRKLRRCRAQVALSRACAAGRAPGLSRSCAHVNWGRLFGDQDPSEALSLYFGKIFELEGEELEKALRLKHELIDGWAADRLDGHALRVSVDVIKRALKRLKPGKSSPDGVTAEMLRSLPEEALESLARDFTRRFATLDVPESWTEVSATLIPKIAAARELKSFRPVSSLAAIRKLWGYVWMELLPNLLFETLQTAFVKGVDAAQGVYSLKRAAELSREWNTPLFAIQIDLKKAFDQISHASVVSALKRKGVPTQLIAVMCKMWLQSSVTAKLGHASSRKIAMHRGVPQGAPDSPLIFTCVMDEILAGLQASWAARGLGWSMDGFWLPAVGYADDVILLANSKQDAETMLHDAIVAFAEAGLDVGMEKTHWTSSCSCAEELVVQGVMIPWSSSITFVGAVLEFGGHDARALQYRIGQAMKQFTTWAPLLQSKWLPLADRFKAYKAALCTSVTWLSSTWHLTVAQENHLRSWAARLAARVVGITRCPDEEMGQFWRRLHREGHKLLIRFDADPVRMYRTQVHRLGGHLARMSEDKIPKQALLTRPLSWWRFQQTGWTDRHSGLHPRRFNCWRWEAHFEEYYGAATLLNADGSPLSVGWLHRAQDRDIWKQSEATFVKARAGVS